MRRACEAVERNSRTVHVIPLGLVRLLAFHNMKLIALSIIAQSLTVAEHKRNDFYCMHFKNTQIFNRHDIDNIFDPGRQIVQTTLTWMQVERAKKNIILEPAAINI